MKKILGGVIFFVLFIIFADVMWLGNKSDTGFQVSAAFYFGTDVTKPILPEEGEKGTDNNPFVILEIVPYEGYAEIGYMISGCEPVPMDKLAFDNSVGGTLASTLGMSYEWKEEYKVSLGAGDVIGTAPGQWEYLSDSNKYRRYRNYFTSKHSFLKKALEVPLEEIENYNIQVVTITPDKLNDPVNYYLIDRADLIYLSPKSHYGSSLISIWEKYHPDKKIEDEPQNFYSNDLTWETTMKILEKTAISNDYAPVIFDVTIFSTDNSYSNNIEPLKYYSTGVKVNSLSATGYSSNTAKLYMIMQQMEPSKFYYEYIEAGRVRAIKVKDTLGNPVITGGVQMTTGYFLDLAEDNTKEYYTKAVADDAAVWNIHTLLPYHAFQDYVALDGNKAFNTLGYCIFTYDGDKTHRSIRHGFYSYNGDNSITQIFLNNDIMENEYNYEAFDYFKEVRGGIRPTSLKPAEAIYYLLHRRNPYYQQSQLHILEIEPCNDFIWDGTKEYWDPSKTPSQDSNNGSAYARQYFFKYLPHFAGKVKITTMTSSEFIGKVDDLNSTYDFIFFGLKDGALRKNSSGITIYNDPLLIGKIYLHVGDLINADPRLRGILGASDTNDNYRFSGNDITKVKREALMYFMNAGYPILFGEDFLKEDKSINTTKIDATSQVYQLASCTSNNLFFADDLNTYELQEALSSSKCRIIFGKTDSSLAEMDSYPKIYKDKTKDHTLTDSDIYINGENIGYRTLGYQFYIKDNTSLDKTYQVKLLIDVNADGKFDELTEDVGSLNIRNSSGYEVAYNNLKAGTNYIVTRNLDDNYNGILPWKLEISDNSCSSNHYSVINYCALKVTEESKIHINVLQIMADTGNNIDLSDHALFKTFTQDLNDYVLHFNTIKVSEFEALCGTLDYSYLLEDSTETRNYDINADGIYVWDDYDLDNLFDVDMLILGFADLYTDISNENALRNLEEYIDRGKTVLFTHDTTSFANLPGTYWGYHLNRRFRETLGMDRFGVTGYENVSERLAAGKDYAPDHLIQGYTDINLNRYASTGQYFNNINFRFDRNIVDEYVTQVNQGQLTRYPFEIDHNFKVAKTHAQYYQLDMESDEIVVWYCLSDDTKDAQGISNGIYSTTPNDVRNNYYIYNKGNITYSGVGHSAILEDSSNLDAVMETKLFINTIIAAYSSNAKEPEIKITNPNKSSDALGMDYIYVDYDIYATNQAYGTELMEGTKQKIRFQVIDNNILYNKRLAVKYFDVDPDTGVETELALETRPIGSNTPVIEIRSKEEYYMEVPLGDLDYKNKGNTTIIRLILTYGLGSSKTITVDRKFTLLRRGLFDLE